MSGLDIQIKDGRGTGNTVAVDSQGSLNVVVHDHPPSPGDDKTDIIPFRSYMLNSAGSNDMQVVGTAAAPIEFSICANDDYDIYIKSMVITIADQNAQLNQFGNLTALTNGCNFFWFTQGIGEVTLDSALKSNFDFVRLSGGAPAFGTTTSAFRASNVEGASEGYIPFIDFQTIYGLSWGLRIRKGTTDRLTIQVRDDTTGVDAFNAVCYGVRGVT